jgi:holo-[acyl-carrier protein] synthase
VVIAVGVDVVEIARMARAIERTPALRARLFGPNDLSGVGSRAEESSLAARFAAKEAVLKALGGHIEGFSWHDIQVRRPVGHPPQLELTGPALQRSKGLGIDTWHLSLSHDGGIATAFVVAESRGQRADV